MKKSLENYNNIRIKIGRDEKPKPVKCEIAPADDPYNFEFSSKKDLHSKRLIFKAKTEPKAASLTPKKPLQSLTRPPSSLNVFNLKRKFIKSKIGQNSDDSECSSDEKGKRVKAVDGLKKQECLDEAICLETEQEMKPDEHKVEISTDEESGQMEPISLNSVKLEEKIIKEETALKNVSVEIKVTKGKEKMSEDSDSENEQHVRLKLKSRSMFERTSERRETLKSSTSDASQAISKTSRRKIFNFKKNHDECKQTLKFNFNPHEEAKESFLETHQKKEETELLNGAEYEMKPMVRTFELDINLRNSRKAYECEELGETQAFLDDIYYFVDGLNARKYRLCDRCLCAVKLAEKCLSSEFRLNLRTSSEYIRKIFSLLKDSTKFQVNFN